MPQLDFGPFLNEIYQLIIVFFFTFFIFLKFFLPNILLVLKLKENFILKLTNLKLLNNNTNLLNLKLTNLIKNSNLTTLLNLNLVTLINLNLLNYFFKTVFVNLNTLTNLNLINLNKLNSLIVIELNKILN